MNWDGGMSWFALEKSWHKMVQAPRPDKEPMLRDPRWRALAREEWDRVPRTMIPHKHADRFGFAGRGRLAEGAAGDLVIFALDELNWAADVFVADLPEGARRLRRPPGGYRYTVVGGTVVQQDGDLTGARPGRVLRP